MKALILITMTFVSFTANAQHTLKVNVANLEDLEGQVEICLYKESEGFMNSSKANECIWLPVTKKSLSHTFKPLESGKYAVILIHDLNGNQSLDTNFLRIPKEPYGFSNNPSTTFGPPDFEGASFVVNQDVEISVKLK